MKVYLAASFSRQDEMRNVRDALESFGVLVTAHWLEEKYSLGGMSDPKSSRECAFTDLNDVKNADVIVRFTDNLKTQSVPARLATGARMVEFGYALALGKPVIVVGGIQNVFDYLPQIIHIKDVSALIDYLSLTAVTVQ